MATKVKTYSHCDLCPTTDEREGAEGSLLPVGWSEIDIVQRGPGSGWSRSIRRMYQVCPSCMEKIDNFLDSLKAEEKE